MIRGVNSTSIDVTGPAPLETAPAPLEMRPRVGLSLFWRTFFLLSLLLIQNVFGFFDSFFEGLFTPLHEVVVALRVVLGETFELRFLFVGEDAGDGLVALLLEREGVLITVSDLAADGFPDATHGFLLFWRKCKLLRELRLHGRGWSRLGLGWDRSRGGQARGEHAGDDTGAQRQHGQSDQNAPGL